MRTLPIILYLVLYALVLASMHLESGFDLAEPLIVLLVFGLGLSLLAIWATRHVIPRNITVKRPGQESAALAGYLIILVSFITWGVRVVRGISAEPLAQAVLVTAAKLLVFVIVPFALWRPIWRYQLGDFVDLRAGLSRHWKALVVLSIALLALQAFLGRARADLAVLQPSTTEMFVAVGVTFPWLFMEAGIVEEYFFRGLVQARVAALLRSEVAGLVVMALIFGLPHSP